MEKAYRVRADSNLTPRTYPVHWGFFITERTRNDSINRTHYRDKEAVVW